MLLEIPNLLEPPQLAKLHELLGGARFVDGKLTAGKAARRVKNNLELGLEPTRMGMLVRILMSAMGHNRVVQFGALPHRVSDPIFARYLPGMTYGDHVDDPLMGAGPRLRTDVSMTVFLSAPETYDGGELVVRTTFGERRVKLGAGDAVIYPSSSVHQVAEVTRGERLVALFWIQSYVRDPARRELLYELGLAREHLIDQEPAALTTQYLDRSYANLMRMWCEL
jgi:PKHD-type hydroxylase